MKTLVVAAMVGLGVLSAFGPEAHQPSQGSNVTASGSGFVRVGADSLFYEEAGEGPALILIHDGLVHREIWDAQFRAFSDRFRVVRYDRRGYGSSSEATEAFSNVDDLRTLCDHLGIEDAGLVGMSSGGRLAIDFTLEYPERVTSLVLVGAVVRGFSYTQHFYTRGGHLPTDLAAAERRAWFAAQDPYEMFSGNHEARERIRELVADSRVFEHRPIPGSSAVPSPPDALGRLGEIEIPTLILVGEFDIPDVHAHAGAINAGIPGSRREIVMRAGHLVPIDQPETFNTLVMDFLDPDR